MKLSVIIPVYNVSAYLEQCVHSVQEQTFTNIEMILVDDGSTDESGRICDRLAQEDGRIQVIHKPNGGLSDARNTGLRYATGEYVLFLDSDDYYADNEVIEKLVAALNQWSYPDDLLFCRIDWYEDIPLFSKEKPYDTRILNRMKMPKECFEYLLAEQRFSMSACFQILKRSVLVDNNIEFVVGLRNEDIDWSIQLWRQLHSVKILNLYGYVYRHRANSITTTLSIQDYRSYDFMFDKWKRLDKNNPNDLLFLQYLAFIYPTMVYGYWQLSDKERKEAYAILEKHNDILMYSTTPKSNRLLQVQRVVGLRICVCLFGLYGSYLKPIIRRLSR